MAAHEMTGSGVGRAVPRKEDDRHLRGMGEFVGDIRLAGMRDLAFARSPIAHGRIVAIQKPAGREQQVFTATDLDYMRMSDEDIEKAIAELKEALRKSSSP